MYASSKDNDSRRVSDSGEWSEVTWDPQRSAYYQARLTSNGRYEYVFLQGEEYNRNEESSVAIPRTVISSNDSSYSCSDEQRGRSREAHSGEPRNLGHSVSPGPQKPPPPPRPGTTQQSEEVSSSSNLSRSMGGLSIGGSSQDTVSDQPYGYYSVSSQPQGATEISAAPYYTSNTPIQKQSAYGEPQPHELSVVLNDFFDITAVLGTSEVSLISQELANELGLADKSISTPPKLDGREKGIRPTKEAFVEIRYLGKGGRKERVYIVPKSQRLRQPLILKKSTMASLVSSADDVTTKSYATVSGYPGSSATGSYGGYSSAPVPGFESMSSTGSYDPPKATAGSYMPDTPSISPSVPHAKSESKPYDSYESPSKHKHKHKHRSSRH
ncbi:hypothetical protein B0J14DRAFT_144994 [Halenospora varia]|nr:hypothetical protein B0J14DRAFT_144994 [Halenospora varia]